MGLFLAVDNGGGSKPASSPEFPSKNKYRKPYLEYLHRLASSNMTRVKDATKFAIIGVKLMCTLSDKDMEEIQKKGLYTFWEFRMKIIGVFESMTPEQIVRAFPPKKVYNGEKNYFSTMSMMEGFPKDVPIGRENVHKFLIEYANDDIKKFCEISYRIASDIFALEEKPPSITEWFEVGMIAPWDKEEKKDGPRQGYQKRWIRAVKQKKGVLGRKKKS